MWHFSFAKLPLHESNRTTCQKHEKLETWTTWKTCQIFSGIYLFIYLFIYLIYLCINIFIYVFTFLCTHLFIYLFISFYFVYLAFLNALCSSIVVLTYLRSTLQVIFPYINYNVTSIYIDQFFVNHVKKIDFNFIWLLSQKHSSGGVL